MTANHAHTPTTQTVRKIFADYANMTEVQRKRDKAAFDRWLSEVEAAAEQRGAEKELRLVASELTMRHLTEDLTDSALELGVRFINLIQDRADQLEG